MISIKPLLVKKVYIGIDLAWGDKNASGFAVLDEGAKLLETTLLFSLDEILNKIIFYAQNYELIIGVDAPLSVENESGNREIEKAFLKDFAKHKIGMLPVNRKIMSKYTKIPRGEQLREALPLEDMCEVYPHSTIAVLFNNYTILPYKQKSGRTKEDIVNALKKYQSFLKSVVSDEENILQTPLKDLTFKVLKAHEDILDAITSAYTLLYCQKNRDKCKEYRDKKALFITPI